MRRYIAFVMNKNNKNSVKALCGALEVSGTKANVLFLKNPKELKGLKSGSLILFSLTTPDFLMRKNLKEWIEASKDHLKIAGGPHPSGDPLRTLDAGFDYVFIGEGEASFPGIARRFLEGKELSGVPGIYKRGLKVSRGPRINLDDFPPVSFLYRRLGAIEIVRGCPHRCKFCQTPYLFGRKVRERSVENILYWVERIFKSGIKDIRFIAPDAFSYGGSPEKIESLLHGTRKIIKDRGKVFFGSFPSEVRPESVTREKVKLVKRFCDNRRIGIGAQSGSRRILDISGRGHGPDEVIRAVETVRNEGLEVYVDFIFGLPHETEEDEEETIRLIKELTKLGAKIHGHTFMPLAGTPYARKRPGKLSERIKKFMGKLAMEGAAFGKWVHQEGLYRSQR